MSKFNLKDFLGNVADVVELSGTVTGNPLLAAAGELVGAIVDDETDTQEYIKDLTASQLLNLQEAITNELRRKCI